MMKLFSLVTATLSLFAMTASANSAGLARELADTLSTYPVHVEQAPGVRDLIDWKVGDYMDYRVSGAFGNMGTMRKEVTSDEGTALWVRQTIDLMGQNEIVDMLIRKSDGKILKVIRNGEEQEVPDGDVEVIEQNYEEVTVPAGTFDSIHIVANTRDVENLQVWVNMRDTSMDGTLKQVVPTNFMTLTMELTGFHRTAE